MASQKKHSKRKSIQISDPGKMLDLVMSLTDDACAQIQIKINSYLTEECEAELVFLIIVNGDRMEASIDAVGGTALPRKHKIGMTQKLTDVLKSLMEQIEIFNTFASDFQAVVGPFIAKENHKKRITMFPIPDKPFSVIVCLVAPKVQEEHVSALIHECFLYVRVRPYTDSLKQLETVRIIRLLQAAAA